MPAYKLGGCLLVLGSIITALEFPLGEQHWFHTPAVLGISALLFGTLILIDYLQKDSGGNNGFLRLANLLVLVGWGATIFSIGMSGALEYSNTASVNAVQSISMRLYLTVGALGFLGNLIIQLVLFNRSDFIQNSLYKASVVLGASGSVVMAVLWSALPQLFEGRDAATAVGAPGDANFVISMGMLGGLWMFGMICTNIWGIWTGLILSKKIKNLIS